jgi:hypothetical protein
MGLWENKLKELAPDLGQICLNWDCKAAGAH